MGHTNYYGARAVTEVLGEYLADMIPKEIIQNREKDDLWEQYAGCYNKWEDFNRLSTITDTEEYFDLLDKYESDVMIIMAIQGDYNALYNNIAAVKMTDLFHSFGITASDTNRVFLYAADTEKADPDEICMNYAGIPIILKSQTDETNIFVNCEDLCKKVDGINVCVYDLSNMTLIDRMAIWNGTPDVIVR